ncbi:hypothetical protein [Deinococcus ficus]|uniref:hypothetical protein n=1 Tax=Deinococcus ficus TaxID=317577 RepID=UPI0018FEE794|nr:hypothetical protein [Deinococcus ficus]
MIHAPRGHHRQDDVHDTLQRVVAQEWSAGFEVAGEFSTLETFGFWDGHTPKTPPFVVPVRDRSHVQEFPVQHSLTSKMSGTEVRLNSTGVRGHPNAQEWLGHPYSSSKFGDIRSVYGDVVRVPDESQTRLNVLVHILETALVQDVSDVDA